MVRLRVEKLSNFISVLMENFPWQLIALFKKKTKPKKPSCWVLLVLGKIRILVFC